MNTNQTAPPIDWDAVLTIIGFVLAIIGFIPCLIVVVKIFPLNLVGDVERALDQVEERLQVALYHNVDIGAHDVLAELGGLEHRFISLRLQANGATTVFKQLTAIIVYGLSCKLFRLKRDVDDLRRVIQIAIDQQVPPVANPIHVVAVPAGVALLPLPDIASVDHMELDVVEADD
ncbi:hypothetical protein OF83DRAFT_1170112 [Amylostereum chailletii]|nr:hypothetical protein OF83DRAFT_1170112 [Amylostereum chailletii]